MADIVHIVSVNGATKEVCRGLIHHWQQWDMARTRDRGAVGANDSLAALRFENLTSHLPTTDDVAASLAWVCVSGPSECVGSEVRFVLTATELLVPQTVLRLDHKNWRETSDFMGRCSTSWAQFLFGFKSMFEIPEPDDTLV